MSPDLVLIATFVAAAEAGSLTSAAERLHTTQPVASKRLRALERRLQCQLLLRLSTGVQLTPIGESLLPGAQQLLIDAAAWQERARTLSANPSLRLGFVGQAANEMTAPMIAEFERRHPDVAVSMQQFGMTELDGGLRRGVSDVAIIRLPIATEGLRVDQILTETRVVVLRDDHPLAGEELLTLDQLSGEPWIVNPSLDAAHQDFTRAVRQRGSTRHVGALVSTIDEFLEAVLARRGVALAPASARRFYARPGIVYVDVIDAEPSIVAVASCEAASAVHSYVDAFHRCALEIAASVQHDAQPSQT